MSHGCWARVIWIDDGAIASENAIDGGSEIGLDGENETGYDGVNGKIFLANEIGNVAVLHHRRYSSHGPPIVEYVFP